MDKSRDPPIAQQELSFLSLKRKFIAVEVVRCCQPKLGVKQEDCPETGLRVKHFRGRGIVQTKFQLHRCETRQRPSS